MTITEKEIKINNIPAIILGNPSRNVYLYIHGQGGNKEEAYNIAEFVCGHGYQMLLDFCIGKAAASVKEFYLLPVGNKLIQYDKLAVNTIVANKDGEVSSCDIAYTDNLEKFNADYLRYTTEVQGTCIDHDLSEEYMVIGTSAIVNVELDGAIGMNSGIFNNPFMIWGKYRIDGDKALLSISFQFHHTQMDGAHAGKFLKNLQEEIERMGETSV